MNTLTDTQRWQAVEQRDAAYDGVFYLAVKTTGIYCRPSCSARTPKRPNIAFYSTPEECERAGFRANEQRHDQHRSGTGASRASH